VTLTSSGTISMGDMRTEFGISGAISMSDLYRGGSEVPSTATTNQGGTITSNATSGQAFGQNGSYNTIVSYALPTTIASGDTIQTNSNILSQLSTFKPGGFAGAATQIYLSNSGGSIVSGGSLASHSTGSTSANLSLSSNLSFNTTLGSSQAGATHLSTQVNGGGAQFQEEETNIQSSLASGSYTLVQNRTANVNTGVPTSGTIAFSDLYGATA